MRSKGMKPVWIGLGLAALLLIVVGLSGTDFARANPGVLALPVGLALLIVIGIGYILLTRA